MKRASAIVLLGVGLASCAAPERPTVAPEPKVADVELQRGTAVYYASRFHGRRTASGEPLDNAEMVAAHPFLPFGCVVRVKIPASAKAVNVRIVDRGPSARDQRRGMIIDLSQAAARELGFFRQGTAQVEVAIPKECRPG